MAGDRVGWSPGSWHSPADLRRTARAVVVARAVAVPWALLIVLGHRLPPYPPGVRAASLAVIGAPVVGNAALWAVLRRPRGGARIRAAVVAGLALDVGVTGTMVWLHAFDPGAATWALPFVPPLEGAVLLALPGALVTWAACTGLYAAREVRGSTVHGYVLSWHSVALRMGIGLLIALVAGLMARDLLAQRAEQARALERAPEADRWRARLVSTLAHDVRSPLTVIRQGIEVPRTGGARMDEERRTELLAAVDRQAERLERLATGLLDLVSGEAGRLELRTTRGPRGGRDDGCGLRGRWPGGRGGGSAGARGGR